MTELNQSILERTYNSGFPCYLLDVQYRMSPIMIGFSNQYFYENKLKSVKQEEGHELIFYDTAGAGMNEIQDETSASTYNPEEIELISKILDAHQLTAKQTAVISPYNAQVQEAKKRLTHELQISTIDSFQGQEKDNIIITLVRSNDRGEIGFLKDYRRMNVALTRARKKLIIIGDSTTLAGDSFYSAFIDYAEKNNSYKSAFEILYT